LIEIGGVPIITRTIDLLRPLFSEIILAGWPAGSDVPSGVVTVSDNFPRLGPLGGIEAAMKAASSPLLFVFGGDMPWLSEEIIRAQADNSLDNPSDILAARTGGLAEPLHSIYRCSIHEQLAQYLREGGSPAVIDFFPLVGTRFYDMPHTAKTARAFTNINRPEDIIPE
jgi:molybdopterin-guanine dinucleotide biosynthesis protein A